MSAAPSISAQKSSDLSAWWRIEAQWQEAKKPTGFAIRVAVAFLDTVLKKERDPLNTSPKLSPKGYARMHHTFASCIGNSNFRHLSRAERAKALLGLTFCAFQAIDWSDRDGKPMAHAWDLCMGNCFDSMGWSDEGETARHDTLHDVLNSALDPLLRLKICQQADALDWTAPTLAPNLETLLPQEEHARLPLLAWSHSSVTANMRVVQLYCPQLYTMLAGLAPTHAWVRQKDMLLFAELLRAPVNAQSMDLPLPDALEVVDHDAHVLFP